MPQDVLNQIAGISVPANNLININLVHRQPQNNGKYIDKKPKHFAFVSSIPGETVSNGTTNRTYNFDASISLKFSLQELEALSFVLRKCGDGLQDYVLPYAKFSRNNNVSKSVSIWISKDKKTNSRIIMLSVSAGDHKISTMFTPADAYAFGYRCHLLFKMGQRMEFKEQHQINTMNTPNPSDTSIQNRSESTPPVDTPPPNRTPIVDEQTTQNFDNVLVNS